MIAIARPKKKLERLSRMLNRRIQKPAPPAVMAWLQSNLRMPEADLKRMKRLYEKVMSDTISRSESAELDSLMEASAALDVLRARVLLGHAPVKGTAKARA
jgi:hypothetical protein